MSNPIEDRLFAAENTIKGLLVTVQQMAGVVSVLEQYLMLNKQFFDQVKVNVPEKPAEKPAEPAIVPEIVEPK